LAPRPGLWITIVLIAVAIGGAVWIWQAWFKTYHFAEVRPGVLYRDGVRSMGEFRHALRKGRIRTVIMLIDNDEIGREPFKGEVEYCRSNGINLIHIPVLVSHRPTTDDVRRFLDVMAEPKNHPALVHCSQGVRRTAMVVAAYQRSAMNYSAEQTKKAMLLWGRKPDRLADIVGFIDDYDPATRTVGANHVVFRPQDAD
jgi:tyrosine-protein phosphatase SIW14